MALTLLQAVLKMSFTGSIVIFVVLIARAMLFKAPKIFSYLLWSIVLFRLLCPVSFFTNISVLQFTDIQDKTIEKNITGKKLVQNSTTAQKTVPQIQNTDKNNNIKNNPDRENTGTKNIYNRFLVWGTVIWLAGIIIMLIHNAIPLVRLKKYLLSAVPLSNILNNPGTINPGTYKGYNNIFICNYITLPFVFGILHPGIYLPPGLSGTEYKYIILHEQIHIKRRDYIIKLLAFAALLIHWFNPLVWLAFHLSEKDMEMSCDEAVIKKTGKDIRALYSTSLLKLASGQKTFIKTLAAFGESETGSRIKHIMKYKKPTITITVMAAFILITTFVFAGGNPPQKNSDNNTINNSKNTPEDKIANNNKPEKTTNPEETTKPEEWWQTWKDGNYIYTMDCAFVRGITKDNLIVDPLEYIDSNNTKRIKELGLDKEYDLITGYYYNNPDKTTTTWKIDENTEFMFLDWWETFKDDKNIIDTYGHSYNVKLTYTKDKEVFCKYLANYKNSQPKMPFFFEVENGVIKKIIEKYFV